MCKKTESIGFAPMQGNPSRFQVCRRNYLANSPLGMMREVFRLYYVRQLFRLLVPPIPQSLYTNSKWLFYWIHSS